MNCRRVSSLIWSGVLLGAYCAGAFSAMQSAGESSFDRTAFQRFVDAHCLNCHDRANATAGLALDEVVLNDIGPSIESWEKVVRKLSARQMPPIDAPRPTEEEYAAALTWLESSLDDAAATNPNPGRTETFRRLTRREYKNAIRDLLGLDIDVEPLLPPDESSHGFDNITVSDLSPALLNRYLSASQKISQLAVGRTPSPPHQDVFRVRPDITQDANIEGLPIGTRGGIAIEYNFPQDGEYEVQVRLMRDRNDEVESLKEPHDLEVLLDRERMQLFALKPVADDESHELADAHLRTRITTTAGPHNLGVAFLAKSASLLETVRQPLNVHFNFYRHPRIGPAVHQVLITGPLKSSGAGNTPSRRRLFICTPGEAGQEEECAKKILANLMRRAYRRPISDDDLNKPLEFYRAGRKECDFEGGIEMAVSSIIVNPQFIFRIERDPPEVPSGTAYAISDVELASRLSFFLWSSIPDDELLTLADRGKLRRPEVLEKQVLRLLSDKRSQALMTNFVGQWLYLENLESINPDMRLYPDFDDNLRQAMRRETELFFESVLRDDRSVLDLIKADYTFVNERLAKHYGLPHVHGSHFRRVMLEDGDRRGGLFRHASILAVTSYATRTSPVLRGQWVLTNLVGAPAPPPPPNVPQLKDNTVSSSLSVRERLQKHRADPACASCHELIDPVGFALENFDAVGRWRDLENGEPIDVSGGFLDGSELAGVTGLEKALLNRPELFVRTLTEKLMTYALGRGVEYYDAPAIRKIVAGASEDDYRFSKLIIGIVQSTPFQMRMSQ